MSDLAIVPCRACEAPVIWAIDADTGGQITVDAVPVDGGNLALEINANTVPIAHRGPMAHTFVQNRADRHTAHATTCATRPVRVGAHAFAIDERVPPDFHGRRWCLCGVPGVPGDQRHPEDAPPLRLRTDPTVVQAAARARDAEILGERPDDEDLLALARRAIAQQDPPTQDLADRAVDRLRDDLRGRDTAS